MRPSINMAEEDKPALGQCKPFFRWGGKGERVNSGGAIIADP